MTLPDHAPIEAPRTPRTVVVSGAGTGMGRAVAERFLAAGATVVALGRRAEPLDRLRDDHPASEVQVVPADLTDPDAVLRVVDALDGRPVDVLVNNAGGVGSAPEPGLHGLLESYRRTVDQNLLSAMLLTEALWPSLARPGGRVVTISSIAAQRGGGGAYGAAKAGLVAWGAELAARGGPDGITVNTVSPGYVQDTEFFSTEGRSRRHDALVAQTLLGRAGTPSDVAGAVHYLASEDAGWITGQVLSVNGGAVLGR
ncbi:SDR family NAD(P)-dependent oxidoreductase [Cellulomonas xiejunii]|uniref:SDR family oxidoreductase n=1 Tax=Cellulomonas xiejunii TaxID=2968083 RepID=A0ABY5KLP3_9CELL|nr:SDR family oxidoreductase [Cellulomonas xiejunii]MCC2319629.1 SDR family oxidoreductase [Cellulomonas xiejunii]UUI71432.1 SDR family oxidoreductase [Cellulomonas xiejunii]